MSDDSNVDYELLSDTNHFIISEDLIPSRTPKAPGIIILSLDGYLDPPLHLHEDLKEGCGGQLWPAGMVLAKFLLRKKEELRGKTIVELGAGGGLVGLALALGLSQPSMGGVLNTLSTPPIVVTDLDILLPLQSHNIILNALSSKAIVSAALAWGLPIPPSLPLSHRQPDVILAADCVYYEPAFSLLLETMEALMGKETICWFCMKKRRRADGIFLKGLRRSFKVKEIEFERKIEDKGVFLYEVRKRRMDEEVSAT